MAAPAPQFTQTFVVERDNYGDFIRIVRQNVIRHCSDRRPNVVPPVLPPEQRVPRLWFHVVLRTATSSITLAVRIDNLYLVGFKTPGPAGAWWEFHNDKEPNTHLIPKANWLGFGGRYQDLVGNVGLAKGLHTVPLGRAQMTTAVDVLARHGTAAMAPAAPGTGAYDLPKSMLVKLVIMVSEGIRFHSVYGTLDKNFNSPVANIARIEGMQVQKWDQISKAILDWGVNPTAQKPNMVELGVGNKNDAARIVALAKDETS
ncbi:unnamed protein product [Urochloa decumbens]|uniref:rRNA N-glycosylase n=1 Tax=Urochloa decumbens TaxID=240449 RepID=A0ABC9DB00_9POAL